MKNDLTELVFILDKSGSMAGMEQDAIGGFNAMIEKQKKEPGAAFVTTILFSNESETIHDRLPLDQIPLMTEADYTVGGCTALLDTIGGAIQHISDIHRYARAEDVPAHTLFMITTDGLENASHTFSSKKVKDMIRKQEKAGWEFLFVAANIDAVETAEKIGIRRERAANYDFSATGTTALFECLCDTVKTVRAGRRVEDSWAEKLKK